MSIYAKLNMKRQWHHIRKWFGSLKNDHWPWIRTLCLLKSEFLKDITVISNFILLDIREKKVWNEPNFLKTYEGIIKLNLIFVIFISEISLFSRHLMMNSFVNIRVWRSSTFYGFLFFRYSTTKTPNAYTTRS